jgi:hypothetical protein
MFFLPSIGRWKKLAVLSLLSLGVGFSALLILNNGKPIAHEIKKRITPNSLIFADSFENKQFPDWSKDLCCEHSFQKVTYPVREGKYAAKITLLRKDPLVENGTRSELKRYDFFGMGTERWYGFSVYLDNNYKVDANSREIITQWHDIPDVLLGETWRTPPLSLITKNGTWFLSQNWDSKQVTKSGQGSKNLTNLGLYDTEKWTDFVFHVKWSYKDDGLIEIWKNKKLVLSQTGPNVYNDFLGPYFKIGIYPNWKKNNDQSKINQREIYIDAIKISDTDFRTEAISSYK